MKILIIALLLLCSCDGRRAPTNVGRFTYEHHAIRALNIYILTDNHSGRQFLVNGPDGGIVEVTK